MDPSLLRHRHAYIKDIQTFYRTHARASLGGPGLGSMNDNFRDITTFQNVVKLNFCDIILGFRLVSSDFTTSTEIPLEI